MAGTTLDTVIVMTTRMAELADFYQRGLQLGEPGFQQERHIGWQVGAVYFGLDAVDEPAGTPPAAIVAWFRVDDLEATYQRLLGLGATSRMEPTLKPWGDRLASVLDPDGNVVGLAHRQSDGTSSS